GGTLEQLVRSKQVVHIADIASEDPSNPSARFGGARSYLAVPMLKDDELLGGIIIYRQEVRPFSDKQVELVRTSPPRRSSPSRIPACSTSCASRCSSRPPPPTCSRSSAAQPSTCRPCCRRSSNPRPDFATPTRRQSRVRRTVCSIAPRPTGSRPNSSKWSAPYRSSRNAAR